MAYYTFQLQAGKELTANVAGRLILVDDLGAAESLDITPISGGRTLKTMPGRKKAFKFFIDFEALILRASVDCTVAMFLSNTDVNLGFADGSNVNVAGAVSINNDIASPIPVMLDNGASALDTIQDLGPVVVGTAAATLVNDAALRGLRVRNGHASAVLAIGGAGVTLANAAVQLMPGETWIENDAAGAHWYAVSDTAGTTVQLQGLKK